MDIIITEQRYKNLIKSILDQHPYIRNLYLMALAALDGNVNFTREEVNAQYERAQDINSTIFESMASCAAEQVNEEYLLSVYKSMGLTPYKTEE